MHLNDNEIILKEILPKKSFFFNLTEKIRIVFSIFYLAISVLLLVNLTLFFSIFAIIIFCSALYISIFRWILRYVSLNNNVYLITNQRIIIAKKRTRQIIKYKNIKEIDLVNAEMNKYFFGNIIFGEPENIFGSNDEPFSPFKRNGMNFSEDEYAFLSVESIDEIIPIFEKLEMKIDKTFY